MCQYQLSILGQRHTADGAQEKRGSKHVLELRDVLTDHRLGDRKPIRRRGERPGICDGREMAGGRT